MTYAFQRFFSAGTLAGSVGSHEHGSAPATVARVDARGEGRHVLDAGRHDVAALAPRLAAVARDREVRVVVAADPRVVEVAGPVGRDAALVGERAVGEAEPELRLVGDLDLRPRAALVMADRDVGRAAPEPRHVHRAGPIDDAVAGAAIAVGLPWIVGRPDPERRIPGQAERVAPVERLRAAGDRRAAGEGAAADRAVVDDLGVAGRPRAALGRRPAEHVLVVGLEARDA